MTSSKPNPAEHVTDHWVRQTFDIDKERKNNKKQSYPRTLFFLGDPPKMPLDDFLKKIKDEVVEYHELDAQHVPDEAEAIIEKEFGGFDDDDRFVVHFVWEVPETDNEVVKRIMNREKAKIVREAERKAKANQKEEEELREFRRLQKKFGKDGC